MSGNGVAAMLLCLKKKKKGKLHAIMEVSEALRMTSENLCNKRGFMLGKKLPVLLKSADMLPCGK